MDIDGNYCKKLPSHAPEPLVLIGFSFFHCFFFWAYHTDINNCLSLTSFLRVSSDIQWHIDYDYCFSLKTRSRYRETVIDGSCRNEKNIQCSSSPSPRHQILIITTARRKIVAIIGYSSNTFSVISLSKTCLYALLCTNEMRVFFEYLIDKEFASIRWSRWWYFFETCLLRKIIRVKEINASIQLGTSDISIYMGLTHQQNPLIHAFFFLFFSFEMSIKNRA